MASELTSYDRVPYRSHPFTQTHPNRLASIARLMGMNPPSPERCRVLELGCASGGNLIPMADQLPESQFVGIDASKLQVKDGQSLIDECQLENVELRYQDILNFPIKDHSFDYIICHGVYSWVPDVVQQTILEICGKCLTPDGVAYISYNTYPGWHMRGMIRDIMRYRARSFESPMTQLAQARGLLEFLSNSVQKDENAYSLLLKSELSAISRADDAYLIHEQLEEINQPNYFHQFAERAEAVGLQYLAEAEFGVTAVENFPENVRSMLQTVSRNVIETEQYMDFLRNRAFRQTLLCRREQPIDHKPHLQQLLHLRVSSSTRSETEVAIKDDSKVVFRRGASTLTTNNPVVKAAMVHLRSIWPKSVPFVELASIARSAVEPRASAVNTDVMSAATRTLAETICRCFATSQLDLSTIEPPFVTEVSQRPTASRLARAQARRASSVTNRLHENLSLDDFQRRVLGTLDGTRDQPAQAALVTEQVLSGDLVMHHDGRRLIDATAVQQVIAASLPETLSALARAGLIVA
ncbi:MAG TPA: class I SAM-dependent methyltransferase [Planctomycetaceae bacterium]|jgi:methyltransferase-like protein/SAM-dependent methyltransferase|nr:class I SAM-dependent methyltransferase [Planctomycetaceae bacterium]